MKRTKTLFAAVVISALLAYRYTAGTQESKGPREVPSVVPEEA